MQTAGRFNEWGALVFGLVLGWITYRTVLSIKSGGVTDLATIVGAVGGAAITQLFTAGSSTFGAYGIGLACGFFLNLVLSLMLARNVEDWNAVKELLGAAG